MCTTGPGSTTAHTLPRAFGGSETTSSVVPHFVAVVCSRTTSQMCRCTSPWMVIGRVQTQHAPFLPRHMRASCGLRRFTSLYRGVALSGRSASRRRSGKSNMAGSHLSAADQRVKRRARFGRWRLGRCAMGTVVRAAPHMRLCGWPTLRGTTRCCAILGCWTHSPRVT